MIALQLSLLLFNLATFQYASAEVYTCTDAKGKKIFTDIKHRCRSMSGAKEEDVKTLDIEPLNLHSQFGAVVSEEYHNYAFRAYERLAGYSLDIVAEKALLDSAPLILEAAIEKLERSVTRAKNTFPPRIAEQFSGVRYFIFSGHEARQGGRKGGQWYFRKGNTTSARFDNSVVVRSAKGFLSYQDDHAAYTAAHELSHAYYYYHRKKIYWLADKAYKNAKQRRLYLKVKRRDGYVIRRAYALTDRREYFAELSKIYHIGNYYYPFNRTDLKTYDPEGYYMITEAFGY